MKRCELCKSLARIYCDSDQASLCWDCDAKVHSANFLVARHSRCLLCDACQSPTPWNASGEKLGSAISFCKQCNGLSNPIEERFGVTDDNDEIDRDDDVDGDDSDHYDEEDSDGDEPDVEDDDEEDNQVVPWSSTPPPPSASLSSSEDVADLCYDL